MSFSKKILIGLVLGAFVGLFLGEYASIFNLAAEAYIKLLQMTVLPYITVSIIHAIGSLNYSLVRRLGIRVGAVLLCVWVLSLIYVLLFSVAFPHMTNASFFSNALTESPEPFDFINLYIPSNPFHSLANNIVPAVVLFSIITGIALIGIEKKKVLLDWLGVMEETIAKATRFIVRLTPYGLFAIAAYTIGTVTIDQIERLEVYLVTYVAVALLFGLWVLPGLISALTPIKSRAVLQETKNAFITAFITSDLFIVLPILTDSCKKLLQEHQITASEGDNMPEVIVPASSRRGFDGRSDCAASRPGRFELKSKIAISKDVQMGFMIPPSIRCHDLGEGSEL
jgi:Na+/H+-dicarboxylate symporter